MNLRSKVDTLMWYLSSPGRRKIIADVLVEKFKPHPKNNTRDEAIKWCEENSTTAQSFFDKEVKIGSGVFKTIDKQFPEIYAMAEKKAAEARTEMGGGADVDLLYNLTLHLKPKSVLETGIAYGWSSLAILLALAINKAGYLYSTDMPYPKRGNEPHVGCVVPDNLKSNWKCWPEPDKYAIPRILRETDSLDLVHYDSDKSFRGRMWAYRLLWKNITEKGVLISDDIDDNVAFKEFCEELGVNPYVIKYENRFVGVIIK